MNFRMDPQAVQPREYEYKPLEDGQIRILHVQPGEKTDTLFIEISHENLDVIEPYRALSWEWGSGRPSEAIRI